MNNTKNVLKSLVVIVALFLSVGSVNAQQKIGHINYAEIFTATADYKKAEGELRALDSTKTNELQGMFAEYQKKQAEAQDMYLNRSEANKETTDAKIQELSMELQEIQRRLEEQQQIAEQELQQRQQELFAPIHQKVGNAVQNVAKEQGFAYIFDVSSTNIPYFAGGDDVSAAVKTKLGITAN